MLDRGEDAVLLMLIFRADSRCFAPNERTDPKFAKVYRRALQKGLIVRPVLLEYDGKDIWYLGEIVCCGKDKIKNSS